MLKMNLKNFKKNLFILGVLFMSFPSISSQLSDRLQIPVEKYLLDNGMTIVLNPYKKSNLCSYLLSVATGSRHETKGITGISHMFEHLMFKGTQKYPHFDKSLSSKGVIGINAFTTHDYTSYKASFPCEQIELILDMESDRWMQVTFTQEELDQERKAVQEERLLRVDNSPTGRLFALFFETLFTKHPYKWPIIGYKQDIAAYTLKDLRHWYKTYYSPNNSTFVLSGNFSKRKVKKAIYKYFSPLEAKNIPQEIKITEPDQMQTRYTSITHNIQSSYVMIGFKVGRGGTKETLALKVLADFLGSGESSRLYKKLVRDKRLVPQISVDLIEILQNNVFFIFYPLLDLKKEDEVKHIIQQEIGSILQGESLTSKDLEKIKNTKLNERVSSLKYTSSRAYLLSRYELLYKDYTKMYDDINYLQHLSFPYIQKVATKYLDLHKMSYVILKPSK